MNETNGKFYTGDLTNSTIENANLNETIIRYANMQNAQLIHVDLRGTTVRASNLSAMNVEGNAWWDMRMNKCDVYGMKFDAGTLEDATVSNSHLVNVTFENCMIDGLMINGVSIKELIENHPDYRCNEETVPQKTVYNEAGARV
ncbi:hypothetical protein PCCS19_05760 [Paenibacillus sp. CCS19]|uniref:pentapeptide repeat-containing protein n=1 Tax=Paenibacillus sp. CCS19 TaxID=3158387 RepID=UPI0025634247|nr:pentapeptide repeat-containing protein [Paenibacillus cellulosilyticus]GMK37522.1 hypothetical protein PCCS19_05760 [Paenibacillus cellulosilyticus]